MQYGHFSNDGKEFIINNVETPSPWINYIYNDSYFSTISNNGGGISYYKSPRHGRITRYRINDVPPDRPGKYIYVKDKDTQQIWSLTWQPVGRNREAYRAVHGFGYTYIDTTIDGIASSVLYFVPLEDDQEIWKALLTNTTSKVKRLSVYGYVEFALGHALIDLINQCDDQHFNRVYFDKTLNSLFATKTYWVTETAGTQHQENKEWDQWVFFTVNHSVAKYETLRERFIGLYRNENNPIAIEQDAMTSRDTDYGNAVGALQVDMELKPGESKDIIFSLGVIPKESFEKKKYNVPRKYYLLTTVESALSAVKKSWDDFFKYAYVETTDRDTNIFVNYWLPYQAKVAFDVGRVASFYYWGIGRGFGFRDTSQDTITMTISQPHKARERILLLSRQMFSTGRVFHHFYRDGQGETTGHCDDPLWFILAVTDYIKETGDIMLLDHLEPFLDGQSGTVMDHLFAVVNFARNNLGKRGLPIFGRGDWNDTLDYIGGDEGGESVWGGQFYVVMLNYFIELLSFLKLEDKCKEIEAFRDQLVKALHDHCWDGDWFIRAFGAGNKKVGSKENQYGKIFLNTQSWAVLARMAERKQLMRAMKSVDQHLDTEFGPKICAPAFREIDPTIGLVTRCTPGKKENAAVFCHPAAWLIQAHCVVGCGNQAYNYFTTMLPNRVDSDRFVAEPYVLSQYITSDEHDSPGRASHSWQTGSAAWMYRISLDYILGIRATYTGLLIDPVIPSHWDHFEFTRIFRGTKYVIQVSNPDGIESGVGKIFVDGKEIVGTILPISENSVCEVRVIMGKGN